MNDTDLLLKVAEQHTVLKFVSGKHLGLCPIHNEKTPSFWIYPDTGKYRCYGCGSAGDAVDLHRELTGESYIEAKKSLGLWDDKRPAPRKRPPQPPTSFASEDRRECYKIARGTLVRMKDCKITYKDRDYLNHEFILKALDGHARRDEFIKKICTDISDRNLKTAGEVSVDIFISLFLNKCYPEGW